jgi:hypothetical protein
MNEKAKAGALKITLSWKVLVFVVIVSVCIALGMGFVENTPVSLADVLKVRHVNLYGYPLVWRGGIEGLAEEYNYFYLFVDFVFWIAIFFMVAAIVEGVSQK